MAEEKKTQTDELRETAQQVFTAGLGALSKAQEEGGKLFQKLVAKGQSYEGPAAEQFEAIRDELKAAFEKVSERATEAQKDVGRQAGSAKQAVGGQVSRARDGIGTVVESLEGQIEKAVAQTLHRMGLPTRAEFKALQEEVRQLTKQLGELSGATADAASTGTGDISVEPTGGGWYEVRLDGTVMDKVQGRRAADAVVERIKKQG
jgi:polyhydroxyalkanoate synthesis regulator phasin